MPRKMAAWVFWAASAYKPLMQVTCRFSSERRQRFHLPLSGKASLADVAARHLGSQTETAELVTGGGEALQFPAERGSFARGSWPTHQGTALDSRWQ